MTDVKYSNAPTYMVIVETRTIKQPWHQEKEVTLWKATEFGPNHLTKAREFARDAVKDKTRRAYVTGVIDEYYGEVIIENHHKEYPPF